MKSRDGNQCGFSHPHPDLPGIAHPDVGEPVSSEATCLYGKTKSKNDAGTRSSLSRPAVGQGLHKLNTQNPDGQLAGLQWQAPALGLPRLRFADAAAAGGDAP